MAGVDPFKKGGSILGDAIGRQATLAKAWAAFLAAFAAESSLELSESTSDVILSPPPDVGAAVVQAAVVAALVWLLPNRKGKGT